MSLVARLEQDLRNEFGSDFDEFDEFWVNFLVCLQEKRGGGCLMSLGVRLMTVAVGLEEELGNEFGRDFDEFDESGGHFLCVFARREGSV